MTDTITSETMKRYLALQKQIADLKLERKTLGERVLKEGANELFEQYPKLKSFSWTQYTPFFNDGDPCYFSAHTCDPYINLVNVDGIIDGRSYEDEETGECFDEIDDDEALLKVTGLTHEEHYGLCKVVQKFLEQIDDEVYESVFGDHVCVRIGRTGIMVEDYDHHS